MNGRPSLRTITLALVALLVPLTMLIGYVAAAYYKSANPNGIDITTSLAYLRQVMVVTIIGFSLLTLTSVGLIVTMYRQDGNFVNAKLPLVLLIAVVALLGTGMAINSYTDSVVEQYRRDHGQMTRTDIIQLGNNIR